MATLGFGVAGAVIGTFTGIGPNTGFIIGSIIGRLLFPEELPDVFGPRLGDTSVSSSAYGQAIPRAYGTVRLGGNMIWSSGIREQENRREASGGKGGFGGGPTQGQVTYSYFASFAMGFAGREAQEVLKIWANSNLIYDKTGEVIVRKSGLSFRFHKGSETQLPDPLIEVDKGTGQVPGHRGLAYIVFDDIPLADFGNRIPNITALISFNAQQTTTVRYSDDFTVGEGGLFNGFQTTRMAVDPKRRKIYAMDLTGANQGLRVYDMDTLNEIRQILETDIMANPPTNISAAPAFSVGDSGFLYFPIGSSNSQPIVKVDPSSLTEVARFGTEHISTSNGTTRFAQSERLVEIAAIDSLPTGPSRRHYLIQVSQLGTRDLGILDADNMTFLGTFNNTLGSVGDSLGVAPGAPEIGKATAWIMRHAGGNVSATIHKVEINSNVAAIESGETFGVTFTNPIFTIPSSTWNDDADAGVSELKGPIFDPSDGGLIFVMGADSFTGSYVFKWREADGVVWTQTTRAQDVINNNAINHSSILLDSLFGWVDTAGVASLIDTTDGTLLLDGFDVQTVDAAFDPIGEMFYDGNSQSIITFISGGPGIIGQAFVDRATGFGEALSVIVEDVSAQVGLDVASDLVTTELTDSVRGYIIGRRMAARRALEPLALAFFFEGVESDDKVTFPKRGKDPDRTLLEADMPVISPETGDVVQEQRIQEVELPESLSVVYMDPDMDYQQGIQSNKRVLQPVPTMRSRNKKTIGLPIVFTASEAEQISEKLLFTAWNERTTYDWRTPWEHLDLDPADVVTLSLDSGSIQVRIIKVVVNADLSISFQALTEDKTTFVSTSDADGGLGFPQKTPPGPAFTKLFLLDIPLLRDVDDTAGIAMRTYFAMNGFQANWPGGTLFDSPGGATFSNTGLRSLTGVSFGVAQTALPQTTLPFQTDVTTQLSVFMDQGALVSVTQTQFLNNESAALIGDPSTSNWEIILFRDVTLQADGSYILSTIMRGRRGTDVHVNSHSAGETFILLDRDDISAILLDLSFRNVTRFYRGVGFNTILEDSDIETLADTGAAEKPYAPVHLDAVVDGGDNIDITWIRRTRIGGDMVDDVNVPLGEVSEEYEVDILDQPGGAVVRAFTGLTSEAVEYAKAQITTDLAITTGVTTLDVSDADTFSRAAGSFLTDGFVTGMKIETTGFTDGANNGIFTVTGVGATTLDVEEGGLVTESGTGDEEIEAIREDDVTFVVYQISASVGRGFGREATIVL